MGDIVLARKIHGNCVNHKKIELYLGCIKSELLKGIEVIIITKKTLGK